MPQVERDEFRYNQRDMRDNDPKMVKIVNDPTMMMDRNGSVMKMLPSAAASMQRSSFSNYPPITTKRTRKKTKMDKTMSKCLKMANARLRNKNGKLKKGKTMSDVMKMAHRLCKKSS